MRVYIYTYYIYNVYTYIYIYMHSGPEPPSEQRNWQNNEVMLIGSFTCVTWLIFVCGSFISVTWLIHMCDITSDVLLGSTCRLALQCRASVVNSQHNLGYDAWLIHMTHSCVWLIHMCDMTHSHVWHDVGYVAWLYIAYATLHLPHTYMFIHIYIYIYVCVYIHTRKRRYKIHRCSNVPIHT